MNSYVVAAASVVTPEILADCAASWPFQGRKSADGSQVILEFQGAEPASLAQLRTDHGYTLQTTEEIAALIKTDPWKVDGGAGSA